MVLSVIIVVIKIIVSVVFYDS